MNIFKKYKKLILLLIDIVLINFAYLSALYFRFTWDTPKVIIDNYIFQAPVITAIYIVLFVVFGLYKSLWIFASIDEFLISIGACISGAVLSLIYGIAIGTRLPYSVCILGGIMTAIVVTGFRLSFRIYRRIILNYNGFRIKDGIRVMVIGAGSAGNVIIREMRRHPELKYKPVALIDDSVFKQGTVISGIKVEGGRERIKEVAESKGVDEIIIAIPSLSNENKAELINICTETGCKIKTIPGLYELIDEQVTLKQIRDVEVEDLLGREQITLDNDGIEGYIKNKVVLVTGGGGSIGSELCRQIAKYNPKELLILDIYENNAYDLQNELKFNYPKLNHKVLIATVRDKKRLDQIFSEYRPQIVFHAAAHKHVPLMEDSPGEAVKNNVFGTLNLAETADKYEVERFVMISTDKAVNPTNVMGATKRTCEMIIQAMNKISKTEYVAVRFGNVLGSNGSVIPLFKKQIAKGGPVTLTHKEITRYFMTIPEAAQLVLQAGAYAEGGEIFVLDMGKPVKIYDLACNLIRLSGFEPERDIKIEVTGLRPGEKLYEELLMAEEGLGTTRHEKIFVGRPAFFDIEVLKRRFNELRFLLELGDKEEIIYKIEEIVPTYRREQNTKNETAMTEERKASKGNVTIVG